MLFEFPALQGLRQEYSCLFQSASTVKEFMWQRNPHACSEICQQVSGRHVC